MDQGRKIPALALLGLQFTAGCEEPDPIVGTWVATQIGDTVFPYEMSYGDAKIVGEAELRIGEGLTGTFWNRFEQSSPFVEYYYAYEYDLEVTPEGEKYRIDIVQRPIQVYGPDGYDTQEQMLVLDCELAAKQLRCTEPDRPDFEYRWRREG